MGQPEFVLKRPDPHLHRFDVIAADEDDRRHLVTGTPGAGSPELPAGWTPITTVLVPAESDREVVAETAAELRRCGDCGVPPGRPHEDGCDVARCTECGWQRLGCVHSQMGTIGWGQVWTGRWPGEAEVEAGLARDLNDLALKAGQGVLSWSRRRQRWEVSRGTA